MERHRWAIESGMFVLWALTGIAGTVTVLGLLTIGVFVLPFTVLLLAAAMLLTFRRPHREFTMVGVLFGPGALSSYIGAAWAARESSADGSRSQLAPLRFLPYAAVTAICLAAAVVLFVVLGRQAHHRHPDLP